MSTRTAGLPGETGNNPAPLMSDSGPDDPGGALGVSLEEGMPGSIGRLGSGRHSGTLVLLLVVVIAGAALWGMRELGKSGMPGFADVKIDYPLDELQLVATDTKGQDILQQLAISQQVPQLPLERVANNPFEWRGAMIQATTVTSAPVVNQVDQAEQARLARLKAIESEFSRLRLNSVMEGSMPVARISGELVRIGDRVGDYFTVQDIRTRRVILEVDDKTYTLTMGD